MMLCSPLVHVISKVTVFIRHYGLMANGGKRSGFTIQRSFQNQVVSKSELNGKK